MANLSVIVPDSLASLLNDAVTQRSTSPDSLVTAALSQYFQTARHRAYQISTSAALVQGVSGGAVSSRKLLANGDFGLGTFEHLDGEMVVLDGIIYQVRGDGTVEARQDDFQVPFAVVSRFQADDNFEVSGISSLDDLERACDPHRESENLFYALRVDGVFERMHTRAVKASSEGTRLLAAAKTQPEFRFKEIEGTLVCVWSPRYSSSSRSRADWGHRRNTRRVDSAFTSAPD